MKLLRLFWELFKISLFVIGGGYAILSVADDVFAKLGWTEEGEIIEKLPVFQMVPGLIATHTAVYVGLKVAGRLGALVGVVAVALPSIVIFTFVSTGYASLPLDNPWLHSAFLGLRAALTGIIAATIIRSWTRSLHDVFSYSLMIATLAALALFDANVALVLVAAMAVGLVKTRTKVFGSVLLPFLIFSKYGLLCFGGGFVLVPLYIESFVGPTAAWLNIPSTEFANILSLTQVTPGPIGVNAATFFGYRLGGIGGAIAASVGLLLPGSVLAYLALTSLERFRSSSVVTGIMRGIRPASIALMLVALGAFATTDSFSPVFVVLTLLTVFFTLKRKINMILLILLSALAAAVVRADDVTPETYPNADTVLLDDRIETVYRADGTSVTTDEEWVKILTEKGRRESSLLTIGYNLRYGTGDIEFVEIIGADGSVRPVDISATKKEATDNESMASNIYDPQDRQLSCSVPDLHVGDIRHVRTRRETHHSRVKDHWFDVEILEYDFPIVQATVSVTGPKERPIRAQALRHPLGNVTESVEELPDGLVRHVWSVTNSPQAFPEPDMPPLYTEVQNLRLSTAESWQEVSRWYWQTSLPHLEATNEAMTNMVADLGYDLRAIYDFVAQQIRYMGLTLEDTSPGYAPHDVSLTFDNRYGVCRDKAALLVAMLRIAGYEAYPVLINASAAKMDPEVPMPYFNHAIVAVAEGDDYILMDPTDESSRDLLPGYLCDCSYLVARPEGEGLRVSPVAPAEANSVSIAGSGELAADGSAVVGYVISFDGVNDNMFRHGFLRRKPEERRRLVERIFGENQAGTEILSFALRPADLSDTSSGLTLSVTVRFPSCVITGADRCELDVPSFSAAFGIVDWLLEGRTALEKRKYPLKLMTTAMAREHLELALDASVLGEPVSLPDGFSVTNGLLVFEREHRLDRVTVPTGDYAAFREELRARETAERARPVFARDRQADADVHVLLSRSDVHLTGERSWVVTNTIEKEILTYDGKKRSAELKYDFNPLWKSIEIVSAVVSNRDGRVTALDPREINVMDADWVAAAPRYPASKTLVVTLPSVEIGSFISVTTATSVTNAPAGFYGRFFFDGFEPTDEIVLSVDGGIVRDERHPALLPTENLQPRGDLWRDTTVLSRSSFEKCDFAIEPVPFAETEIGAIRDWMAKNVRIAGPGLHELPLDAQLTDPAVVLRERYASRLDYIRTLCSILKGAGYEPELLLGPSDAEASERAVEHDRQIHPNVRAYDRPFCRVNGLCIGTESEYTPLGATIFDGTDVFNPATGEFERIHVADPARCEGCRREMRFVVQEEGTVDVEVRESYTGPSAGAFRKRYAEMLPEDRSRHFQSLLSDLSKSARATGELVTDLDGDRAVLSYKATIPDFAVRTDDLLTIELPGLSESLFPLTGRTRRSPIELPAVSPGEKVFEVVFPEGYDIVEHLPETPLAFESAGFGGLFGTSSTRVENGHLIVTVTRSSGSSKKGFSAADRFPLFQEWSRRLASRSNRVITVRKGP